MIWYLWIYALLAGVIYGLDIQLSKLATKHSSWLVLSTGRYVIRGLIGAIVLVSFVIWAVKTKSFKNSELTLSDTVYVVPKYKFLKVKLIWLVVFMCVIVTTLGIAWMWGISSTSTPSTFSATISCAMVMCAALFGLWLYDRPLGKIQMCGIGFAVAAIVLMNWKPRNATQNTLDVVMDQPQLLASG